MTCCCCLLFAGDAPTSKPGIGTIVSLPGDSEIIDKRVLCVMYTCDLRLDFAASGKAPGRSLGLMLTPGSDIGSQRSKKARTAGLIAIPPAVLSDAVLTATGTYMPK